MGLTLTLTERAGIGDEKVLQPLGVPVLYNLPGVGNNLREYQSLCQRVDVYVLSRGSAMDKHQDRKSVV